MNAYLDTSALVAWCNPADELARSLHTWRQAVNPEIAREWITVNNPNFPDAPKAVQYMSFNTPIGVPEEQICGRAVYTDLHVAAVDNNNTLNALGFPASCEMRDLSAQEKAVAFMLFDLSSCVQNDDDPPQVPK